MEYIKMEHKVKILTNGKYIILKIFQLIPYKLIYKNQFLPMSKDRISSEDNAVRIADQIINYIVKGTTKC